MIRPGEGRSFLFFKRHIHWKVCEKLVKDWVLFWELVAIYAYWHAIPAYQPKYASSAWGEHWQWLAQINQACKHRKVLLIKNRLPPKIILRKYFVLNSFMKLAPGYFYLCEYVWEFDNMPVSFTCFHNTICAQPQSWYTFCKSKTPNEQQINIE